MLRAAAKQLAQGFPATPEAGKAIKDVGFAATPWLLSQKQWQCMQCERPATQLSHQMTLGSSPLDPLLATNSVPWCVPPDNT